MENGSAECWEIVDYYSPACVGDEVSETEEEKSKLRWIIDTGFSLGKKLVITGVVITSAPLVLPPLVVVSALGCALSVPFAVVFASYACTQKLMSKLLPSPTLLLTYDKEEEEQVVVDIEKEEGEEREAMKDGIEARIELVDYNESLDGYLEEKDGGLFNSAEVGEPNKEEIREQDGEEYEKPCLDIAEKTDDYGVDMECKGQNIVDSSRKDVNSQVQIDTSMENEGEKGISEKTEREDLLQDQNEIVESTTVATVKVIDKDEKRRSGKRGKRKTLASLKFHGKRKEPEEGKRHEKLSGEDKGVIQEETKAISENNLSLGEKPFPEANSEELSTDKEQADEEKCIVVLGGENLDVDQVSVKSNRDDDDDDIESSLEKEGEPVGLKKISDVSFETNGETAVAGASGTPEAFAENSGTIGDDDSAEVRYGDEEIWKKMEAIRVIVGFKAPRFASYFEELKSMYLFTGIEPPSDFSVDSSSPDSAADFQKKLCFLMSVIGLK